MSGEYQFFAPSPRGSATVVARELAELGAEQIEAGRAGVGFCGPLAVGLRACLWLRSASRVLLELARFESRDADALYAGVREVDWTAQLGASRTLAVDARGTNRALRDERFVARRVKDAIVDQIRERTGQRPSVDTERPDLRVALRLASTRATLSIDLAGESLHRRGYRGAQLAAPIKETVAATMLALAGWPHLPEGGVDLVDPLCGSGTLLVEAAWMAIDRAPGLSRRRWGFEGWGGHQPALWASLVDEARARATAGAAAYRGKITGYDADARALRAALENIQAAEVERWVHVERRALQDALPRGEGGLVITNPPYGTRLGDAVTAGATYDALGELLRARFVPGWTAAVIASEEALIRRLRVTPRERHALRNGGLDCELALLDPGDAGPSTRRGRGGAGSPAAAGSGPPSASPSAPGVAVDAGPFENRIRKNLRRLKPWLAREKPEAYRVYDVDIPEFNLAVDRYGPWVYVQEYEAPEEIEIALATARRRAALAALPELLGVGRERVVLETRRRQRGTAQYERREDSNEYFELREGPARLLVNLRDYLDTGLFLDHRPARGWIRAEAAGQRFLNLFCYTGAVTVHAALGGAMSSTSVDLSQRYLDWAARNLAINGIDPRHHELLRADVLPWLDEAAARGRKWTLAFVDPPTFSNSKRMTGTWDVKRDHGQLLEKVAAVMAPGSTTIFSCNRRSFRLDDLSAHFEVEDVTEASLPPDFPRRPPAHRAWRLVRK